MLRRLAFASLFVFVLAAPPHEVVAQVEVAGWGNIAGIRVEGQMMPINSSLCTVGNDWSQVVRTAKERQRPEYEREGDAQIVRTNLGSLSFTQVVRDLEAGTASVDVEVTAEADTSLTGAFFCMTLPGEWYVDSTIRVAAPATGPAELTLDDVPEGADETYVQTTAEGIRFTAPERQLDISFDEPGEVIVRDDPDSDDVQVYLALLADEIEAGTTARTQITLEATGEIDRSPVRITVDANNPGRPFDGLGGNFRLQNAETDPPVIQYNLENLRVAWGRVEMPWRFWHPDEDVNPVEAAERGDLHPRVDAAMNMARRLAQRDMPVILSAWSGPDWAIVGEYTRGTGPEGLRGNALDPDKMNQIYASIGAYIRYMKDHYGVEARMFSFNESDLGIYIRQTGEEHAAFIRGMGDHLAELGLTTGLVLGDNSDATTIDFIRPTMQDPAVMQHVDAVSFHSWRGWSDELLTAWGEAAREAGAPLLIGEGSTDAAAWNYPDIFDEHSFAHEEITLYTRILALAEPLSILQWQLTADYSILAGGGVFGNDEEPLRPTQRFWNLKQLASTPAGAFALPATCDQPPVHCAAFGEIAKGQYAVHVVNDGASRPATVTGLPDDLSELRVYTTNDTLEMHEGESVPVVGGTAEFTVEPASFTTLIGAR